MMGVISIEIFLPICLQEKGIERAGELVSNYSGAIVVFTILGGVISDKLGKRKPLLIFGTVITGLFAIPLPTLPVIPLIIALIICGTGFGVIIPVLFTMAAEMKEIGTELTATVIGLFLMFESIGAFLGPIIAGKLIDITGSYLGAYIFMGATIIAASAFCIPVKDTGSKSRQDADGR